MTAYDTLLAEARGRPFAAIVAWPVEHSRSPALHGFWLKQHGIDGHYGRLPVEPKRAALEELVAFLRRTPNARGWTTVQVLRPHRIHARAGAVPGGAARHTIDTLADLPALLGR